MEFVIFDVLYWIYFVSLMLEINKNRQRTDLKFHRTQINPNFVYFQTYN